MTKNAAFVTCDPEDIAGSSILCWEMVCGAMRHEWSQRKIPTGEAPAGMLSIADFPLLYGAPAAQRIQSKNSATFSRSASERAASSCWSLPRAEGGPSIPRKNSAGVMSK